MIKKTVLSLLSSSGFTLIELIVVFSVIAIISTIGVAAFVNYSRIQTLNQSSIDFITVLNTAKSKASSQIKPSITECNGINVLMGYSVTLNTSAGTYSLNVVCTGGAVSQTNTTLPSGISFNTALSTPPTTTTSIFFSVLTSAVTGAGDVVLSGFNQTKTITVTTEGLIQ